jgi:hypothetical protein
LLTDSSDLPKEQQDDQNQKDLAESAAGIVSPAPAVRPGGQCADKYEDYKTIISIVPMAFLLAVA